MLGIQLVANIMRFNAIGFLWCFLYSRVHINKPASLGHLKTNSHQIISEKTTETYEKFVRNYPERINNFS